VSERESRRHFTELVAQDADADLAEAALLIACEEYPTLDVASYIHRLEELAGELRRRLDGYGSPEAAVAALNKLLFAEGGFRGNLEDYYDPRNSFLNEVLDRRTGIPITLSAVYLEVGRRAGLDLHGVGLPGHFVVKLEAPGRELIIDPFHAGALVSAADCQRRLDRIYAGRVKLERSMLAPWSSRQILGRLLRNLKLIYVKRHDWQRALAVVELLLCCEPDSTDELRDRGLLYAALDCFDLAARDLEDYVARAPHAPEAMRIRDKAAEMRRRAARLN
jgi:regulator of sirC expression with transglutaminase-like and TPR domain